jgi:hypothetical protein
LTLTVISLTPNSDEICLFIRPAVTKAMTIPRLINRLEAGARNARPGRLADHLTRMETTRSSA